LASDFALTIFQTAKADRKEERRFNLQELEALVIGETAPTKDALPWLKLARFGDKRTKRGSLRHDANVLGITGIEADYDGEKIAFEVAVEKLAGAGIRSLLYTSPSHTEDTPRWRVLCPTSKELPPEARGHLVARLNGILGGILAPESFTLSQSYFYGAIGRNPSHQAVNLPGKPIDEAEELDAGAIGKPSKPKVPPAGRSQREVGFTFQHHGTAWGRAALVRECNAIRAAGPGQKWHAINRAGYAIGGLVAAGELQEGPALASLKDAVHSLEAQCDDFGHALRTLEMGFADGKAAPRAAPPPRPAVPRYMQLSPPKNDQTISDVEPLPGTDTPHDIEPLPGRDTPHDIELTEDGVALEFERRFHHLLRYCHTLKRWHEWQETHWHPNKDHKAFHWARELVRQHNRKAEPKIKAITGKTAFAGGVEKFAQAARCFAVTAEIWDADHWLLGTPGGIVDLRTGQLRPAKQEDFVTKIAATTPADRTDCPIWLAFLQQATGGDRDLIRFLQQWAGYCLTGIIREHALVFIYGPGGNGKSVFLNILRAILADYCSTAAMDTFTEAGTRRHLTFLAMLRGARLVTATETEEGEPWAEARIKQMTGGDPITANVMRGDPFTFTPAFKLTIAGNHKPALRNVDEAMKRRFNVVPFLHVPEKPDRELETKLQAELPGILRWAIEGCLDWQAHGLARPQVVLHATADYLEGQDLIGRWIAERCIMAPHLEVKPGQLVSDCRAWAQANGETPPAASQLRGALERVRGIRYATTRGIRTWKGIGLRPDQDTRQGAGGCG
jgi:P4 family phage/plasmid primase-like protien